MRIVRLTTLVAVAAAGAFADNWSKDWSVSGTPEFRADVGDGRIEVRPGSGNTVSARVTTEGWRIGPNDVNIIEHQNGNRVELEIRVPHTNWSSGRRDIRVEVTLPSNTLTDVHTGDGEIHVEGMRANIQAESGDGAIEILDVDGRLHARSGDGHIKIRGRFDDLDLETGDGSIDGELLDGSQPNSGWRVHTGDGSVTLRVPPGLRADFEAHTGDGSVTMDLPVTMDGFGKTRNTVRGKLNGGGAPFNVSSGDGSIHIEQI